MSSQSLDAQLESAALPQHIAIIMDGNGRWAKARGKARVFGHKAGVKAVRKTVKAASELGVKALTLFAFSSENWRRPEDEVSVLMELFINVLSREAKRLHSHGVQLRIIGDTSRFSPSLQAKIAEAQALTANNDRLVLNIAANYGGQWDITQAARRVAEDVVAGHLQPNDIGEQDIARHLMLADLPDVDLMIRTSGECRISNFILWQAAYAELCFTEQYWPDFNEQSLYDAVAWYVNRERRFGCTGEQIKAMITMDK